MNAAFTVVIQGFSRNGLLLMSLSLSRSSLKCCLLYLSLVAHCKSSSKFHSLLQWPNYKMRYPILLRKGVS